MSNLRFGKCPTWWVRNEILKTGFRGGAKAGESIAGLKCLIAITHHLDFHTLEAKLSYSNLEMLTGLSRPMVSKGLKLINDLEIIEITKGYPSTYKIINSYDGDDKWAKFPILYLKKELSTFPNKGRISLYSLKLYIQLLADRPNDSNTISMSHETIVKKVGTQTRDVKPSIDILFNHLLIGVSKSINRSTDRKEFSSNVYELRGL